MPLAGLGWLFWESVKYSDTLGAHIVGNMGRNSWFMAVFRGFLGDMGQIAGVKFSDTGVFGGFGEILELLLFNGLWNFDVSH